jgi:type II secretory pathway pseudopilin PulG
MKSRFSDHGQSLIELLVALSVGVLIIGSAATAVVFTVRSNAQNRATEAASTLAQELLSQLRSVAESNWLSIYNLSKSGTSEYHYYLDANLTVKAGEEDETINPAMRINGIAYRRYFMVADVNRDNCGTREIVNSAQTGCSASQTGILDDPSTQKITVKVNWLVGENPAELAVTEYLIRGKNETNLFTDWSGSAGVSGPVDKPTKDYFDKSSNLDSTTSPGALKLVP